MGERSVLFARPVSLRMVPCDKHCSRMDGDIRKVIAIVVVYYDNNATRLCDILKLVWWQVETLSTIDVFEL